MRFLKDAILQELPHHHFDPNQKLVLFIQGLEKSIGLDKDAPYPPVLQDLNFVRDAYSQQLPHTLLFVLPDYGLTRLARFAPDFWSWRSGVFRFKASPLIRRNAFDELQKFPELPQEFILPEEQQPKIELLHRLLMEYAPTGKIIAWRVNLLFSIFTNN